MMKELLQPLLDFQGLWANDFSRGYLCGCGLALSLLFLWIIIRIIFIFSKRYRRADGIELPGKDQGKIVISRQAIFSTLKEIATRYPAFRIQKLYLEQRKKQFRLRIQLTFSASNDQLPQHAETFRAETGRFLEEKLGISSIQDIVLEIQDIVKPRND